MLLLFPAPNIITYKTNSPFGDFTSRWIMFSQADKAVLMGHFIDGRVSVQTLMLPQMQRMELTV